MQINHTEIETSQLKDTYIYVSNIISLSHDFAGTDRFHVLFKLSYGKEILVSLTENIP